MPTSWKLDNAGGGTGIRWRSPIPGLGHSSPVLWGDRIFVPTAISRDGRSPLKLGPGGAPTAADDHGEQTWMVLCYDKRSGRELWRRTAHEGKPRAERHMKASHANTTAATDGRHVVAFFGSEGLYCYDPDGRLLWSKDLGVVDVSKYDIGWGYASSPAIHKDYLVLLCDDPDHPFLVTLRLSDGKELWRTSRRGLCERSWATPLIHAYDGVTQVVANGWPWIVSYELETGKELWRLKGAGDNPAPTPFVANGWIYITNAHGGPSPIYVVRPEARGDITPPAGTTSTDSIVWSTLRGGSYMSTPVVYGDYIYFGNTNGVVRCFEARTGRPVFEERLGPGAAVYASLVAADGKVYCPSEDGTVYVLEAGPSFEVIARNDMTEPCFGTPAISNGALYFRTTRSLISIA